MQIAGQPEFDPRAAHVARRAFRFDGRDFAPGEPFDASTIPPRQARVLHDRRFIVPAAVSEGRRLTVQAGADYFDRPAPKLQDAPPTGRLVPAGGGWYDVVNADGRVLNPRRLRKQEALRLLGEAPS